LRTELGRAEVLLTPGVVLRVAENSAIRMISTALSDTRVELLSGNVILESNETRKDTAVTLIHKAWQVRVPHQGVYRIDSTPPQVRVYKGEVEVIAAGDKTPVVVKEDDVLPLAAVLLTERPNSAAGDSFKAWAMNRSQAIDADNATASGIIDDPGQFDSVAGVASGGYTYFPPLGASSLGVTNPYGVSFWSPYQSMLSAIYFPSYLYGGYGFGYAGYGGRGWPRSGWTGGVGTYPGGLRSLPRPIYPTPINNVPWRPGGGTRLPPGITPARNTYSAPSHTMPHVPAPAVGGHAPVHR
jgi:hypothetical protein